MDLGCKPPKLEQFFSPTREPHSLSTIWDQNTKSDITDMESTSYDIDEHSSCNSKEETDSNKDSESSELPADALQWKNGVGMLTGSDIKFRMNELGVMEVINDNEESEIETNHLKDLNNNEMDGMKTNEEVPGGLVINVSKEKTMANDDEVSVKDDVNSQQPTTSLSYPSENSAVQDDSVQKAIDGGVADDSDQNELNHMDEHIPDKDEVAPETVLLEDNLDQFDPVLSEDIATMLYENTDLKQNDQNHNVWSPKSVEDLKTEPTQSPLRCIICNIPTRLGTLRGRFCSRRCLGKNAGMSRRGSGASAKIKKPKVERRNSRRHSSEKYRNDSHHGNLLSIVENGENDGHDLKIKIRLSSSSSNSLPTESDVGWKRKRVNRVEVEQTVNRSRQFSWDKYLVESNASAVPLTAFQEITDRELFPPKNPFQSGCALEGVDPLHENLICPLMVVEIRGCRLRLRFLGYEECHDFWTNANSLLLFPCGFCEKTGRILQPPKGYTECDFDWKTYMNQHKIKPVPNSSFSVISERRKSLFSTNDKLEAVDKYNPGLVCVATVKDVIGDQILVHFDGWNHDYNYWCPSSSQYLHPVGWCDRYDMHLTPPQNYPYPENFSWTKYLLTGESKVAEEKAFSKLQSTKFKSGMKLEAVDPRNRVLIRVASVAEVKGSQLKIHFDGWSDIYDFWSLAESPDIHPVGWCVRTGYPLQAPPSLEDTEDSNGCPIPGCEGIGHIKGPKFTHHYSEYGCPYSSQNLVKEIKDRFATDKQLRPISKSISHVNAESEDQDPDYCASYVKRPRRSACTTVARCTRRTRASLSPSPQPTTKRNFTHLTPAHSILNGTTKRVNNWTVGDVANFIGKLTDEPLYGKIFAREEIDGEAILLITRGDILRVLNIKHDIASKISTAIADIKQLY